MSIYQKIYDNLVESKKGLQKEWKPVGSGLERHRIIPGHQGGTYDESNCSYLDAREHKIAHWLLWKINNHPNDLRAWKMMAKHTNGILHSEEAKAKISAAAKRRSRPQTEETRRRISEAMKGHKVSKETRKKISKKLQGNIPWNKRTIPL